MQVTDILIIGGGLAGLTSAIHLTKCGLSVTLIEKESYPHHKVCGEYISNEVLPYLKWLGADPSELNPANITELEFTNVSGGMLSARLPLGGFGLSRYAFDHFLFEKATNNGCKLIQDVAISVKYLDNEFEVITQSGAIYRSKIVIGAFGKRSNLDVKLSRNFIQNKSPWMAVKGHYSGISTGNVVSLHNFDGGYCGVSEIENSVINICYLVQYNSFKKFKNIEEHQKNVLYKNKALKDIFEQVTPIFTKPLTISQISFEHKAAVEEHILMIGDTAGLIHPLCGNGMAMAIHSAKIVAEAVVSFLNHEVTRSEMEQNYQHNWNDLFKQRLRNGRRIAELLQRKRLSGLVMRGMTTFPGLLPYMIRTTHGKPIKMDGY